MFTKNEKTAITKAMLMVAAADGVLHDGEKAYIGQLMDVLDLEPENARKAGEMDITECMSILSKMSDENKGSLVIILDEMAKADGIIDDDEIKIMLGVFIGAGINLNS